MTAPGMTVGQIRQSARTAAQDVLDEHWDGTLPVDPVALARSLGVSVFDAQLGEDTWGMIIGAAGGSADIYLDQDQPPARYRFSCAHELGHYVDNRETLVPGQGYTDKRSDAGRGSANEIFANEFAGSLLMPADLFKEMVGIMGSDIATAKAFGVSLDAVKYRRHHLGLS